MSSVVAAIPAAPALPTESVLTQVGGTLGGILLLIRRWPGWSSAGIRHPSTRRASAQRPRQL
ncbi:hypothetical protein O0544_16390 [Edwardsiella anguillarum]|nr:hypothetical protein [Edwardsiella anguillarum]